MRGSTTRGRHFTGGKQSVPARAEDAVRMLERFTRKEIAEHFGVKRSTVDTWVKQVLEARQDEKRSG
jgi:DNA-directed RNA polymerase specialized sigma24 family protein